MPSPYRHRVIVMESGERLPALLDDATGLPLFDSMAYVLSEVRAKGRAANTITSHLAAIELLLVHCSANSIDLAERIRSGQLLDIYEIDGLAAACRMTLAETVQRLDTAPASQAVPRIAVAALESVRRRSRRITARQVDQDTCAHKSDRYLSTMICVSCSPRSAKASKSAFDIGAKSVG